MTSDGTRESDAAEPEPAPEPAPETESEPEPPPTEEPTIVAEPAGEPSPTEEPTIVAEPAGEAPPKRLMRSRDDRVVAGVCGGLGEYLGVDSVLIRIAALILVFAGGAGILLYLIGWIAMPEAPEKPAGAPPTTPVERRSGAFVLGLVFVFLGILFLVDEIWSDVLAWKYVWPIALIVVGAAILLRPRR